LFGFEGADHAIANRAIITCVHPPPPTACTGIWDCLSSQRVIDFVSLKVAEGLDLGQVCEELMSFCLSPNPRVCGADNMTCIIVAFYHGRTPEDWARSIRERVALRPPPPFAKSDP
jgi:hypothetical protein